MKNIIIAVVFVLVLVVNAYSHQVKNLNVDMVACHITTIQCH